MGQVVDVHRADGHNNNITFEGTTSTVLYYTKS